MSISITADEELIEATRNRPKKFTQNITNTENRTPNYFILSQMPHPLGHMLTLSYGCVIRMEPKVNAEMSIVMLRKTVDL